MRSNEIKTIIILILLLVLALFNNFIYPFYTATSYSNIIVWLVILGLSIVLLGFSKDKTLNKIDIIQIVVIYTFTYLIITYVLGLLFSYTKNPLDLSFLKIISNMIPALIMIILQELVRYVMIKKNDRTWILSLIVVVLAAVRIINGLSNYSVNSATDLFELIGYLIIPSIIDNLLLTYLTSKAGYAPSMTYRFILELYVYIVPVFPYFGLYIGSLFNIVFPAILFIKLNTMLAKNHFKKYRTNRLKTMLITIPLMTILVTLVCLVSGLFNYYAIAIGSESMIPNIKKGDAVIIHKLNSFTDLEVGDVIAYQHDHKIIVHRLVAIHKEGTQLVFNTKGDANESDDSWDIYESDIKGEVILKIDYIGYPSIWLSEALSHK